MELIELSVDINDAELANLLANDLAEFKKELNSAVSTALNSVGAEMRTALQKHIEQDVYAAYTPKVYARRSENSALGTPLNNMDANTQLYNSGAQITINYAPSGEHTNSKWADVSGNELIGRIENNSPPYKYGNGVPNRPFWQNFVNEMVEQDALYNAFANAMGNLEFEITSTDGTVMRDAEDGNYEV